MRARCYRCGRFIPFDRKSNHNPCPKCGVQRIWLEPGREWPGVQKYVFTRLPDWSQGKVSQIHYKEGRHETPGDS